ncbi:AAA family ATPase [Ferrimonas aestuarii]|uniref:AAA family ATPase n=2 Tax=Ferrimonas aestuarii TaxID=2569539 RepID=A0A4U1BP90_9GAMM|nr:AAA family ATPase [Ferrimonas aestuarii]
MQVQTTILKFTKMLSTVLDVDAEVVDANLVRIAGTGPCNRLLGKKLTSSARLFKYVLETGQDKVVIHARQDALCADCNCRDNCREKAFLGVPIMMEARCIGVISLVAFTDEQQQRIHDNLQIFTDYVRHIAQIFVAKVVEESRSHSAIDRIFMSLIDHMDQGVLVLDEDDHVLMGNEKALCQLGLHSSDIESEQILIKALTTHAEGHQQHIITIGKRQELVIGQFHEIQGCQLFLMAFFQPNSQLETAPDADTTLSNVVGDCRPMKAIKHLISRIADSPSSVLIHGESGTGKEVIASAIHQSSQRKSKPFIAINCAAIPEQLLESELFGYVKGAFTGASSNGKTGLIRAADKGTLFLDEIGDMPLALQAKLLRVLESREVMPIGASKPVPVDIRVVSATNQDFQQMITEGKFRQDLYYRLNVIPMFLPALRERDGDINLLLHRFLEIHSQKIGVSYPGVSDEVLWALNHYQWPGNVRELSNLVEYLVNVVPTGEMIDTDLLPPYIQAPELPVQSQTETSATISINKEDASLQDMEAQLIKSTLARVQNRKMAAKELGIGIATLYRKIKKYGLNNIEY